MSSTSSDIEVDGAIDFFKNILRIQAKPIHYRKLSEYFILDYAQSKSFFHSYSDSEKFAFFKNHSSSFTIDGNGFVASTVEDDIIEAFRELLKNSVPQHFLKVINSTEISRTYFNWSSTSEKFKFFKDHTQFFSIENNGYVKFSEEAHVTCFDENEAQLLPFFKYHLMSYGPTYFTWLFDYYEKHSGDSVTFEVDTERLLWNFFKGHPLDFIISDSGFVDLSQHLKSQVKVDAIIEGKQDEVVGFFIAKLAFFGSLMFPILLKLLQESILDIRSFFAKCSLSEVNKFFIKYSNIFISEGKIISLLDTVSHNGFINFGDSKYPFEDQQQAIFFFLDCLKIECPKHHVHLSQLLEKSNIETDYKHAFVGSSNSVQYWFFKNNPELFSERPDGYVSYHSLFKLSDAGKHAVQHFANELKVSSATNFWTLINSAEASSEEFRNYFANFSPLDKFYFFKKFPAVFNVDSSGYVSCEVEPNLFPEVDVINKLVAKLKKSQPIHFEKLCRHVENDSELSKEFFEPFSVSQKYKFLKSKPNHFCVDQDGYVCVPTLSSKLEDTVPNNVLKSYHPPVSITHTAIHAISKTTNNEKYRLTLPSLDSSPINIADTSKYGISKANDAQSIAVTSFSSILLHKPYVWRSMTFSSPCAITCQTTDQPSSSSGSSEVSATDTSEYVSSKANDSQSTAVGLCSDSALVSVADTFKDVGFAADDACVSYADSSSVNITDIPEYISSAANDASYSPSHSYTDFSPVNIAHASEYVDSESYTASVVVNDVQHGSIVSSSNSPSLTSKDNSIQAISVATSTPCSSTMSHSDNPPASITTISLPVSFEINNASCSSTISYDAEVTHSTEANGESTMLISDVQSSNQISHLNSTVDSIVQDTSMKSGVDFIFPKDLPYTTVQQDVSELLNELINKVESKSKITLGDNPEFGVKTVFNKATKLPVPMSPPHDLLSDADTLEEMHKTEQVIKSLSNILKAYKRVHFEKLCSYELSNYFFSYSIKEKQEFFKNHEEYFSMSIDGYICIPGSTQTTDCISVLSSNNVELHQNATKPILVSPIENAVNKEQSNTPILRSTNGFIHNESLIPCASRASHVTSSAKDSLNTSLLLSSYVPGFSSFSKDRQTFPKEDDVIALLKYHLHIHKRMHCLKLCKLAKTSFMTSVSQKFCFFKDRPQHFCIDNDGYVTFPFDAAKQLYSNVSLKSLEAAAYGNSSKVSRKRKRKKKRNEIKETLVNMFTSSTIQEKLGHFKNRPNDFSVSPGGNVLLPHGNQASKSNSVISLNSVGGESRFAILPGKIPVDGQKSVKLGNIDNSESNSKMNKTDFTIKTEVLKKDNIALCGQDLPDTTSQTFVRYIASSADETYVIEILKRHLQLCKHMHYLEFCLCVEKLNKKVQDFFASKFSFEKLHFFKRYPNHFHLSADNYVSLSGTTEDPFKSTSIVKVASSIPFKCQNISENEIIDNLIDSLKVLQRVHFEKLCKHNDKIKNFFISYSTSERYKFYKSRPHFFSFSQGYVSLSGNVKYLLNIKSTTVSSNNSAVVEHVNSNGNRQTNCGSIRPLKAIPSQLHEQIVGSDPLSHHRPIVSATNGIGKAITNGQSQNNSEKKSTPICETKHVGSNICMSSDGLDTNANTAVHAKILGAHNFEANSSVVIDSNQAKVGHPHYSSETESKFSGDNLKTDIEYASKQVYKSDINNDAAMRLQMREVESTLQYSEPDFTFDHREEIIGTLVRQLKISKRVHFVKLCESCEEQNDVVKNFFYFLSNDEKLDVLKAFPQYFVIDNTGFVTASNVWKTSNTLISCEESLENGCSNQNNSKNRQVENTFRDKERVTSGNEICFNSEAAIKSVEEIANKSNVSSMDTPQYDKFRPLVGHHHEVITTLVDQLKIDKHMYFMKLCRLSEECNAVVKNFFYFFSDTDRLEFLRSYPQYFSIDSNGFVTLSRIKESSENVFVPSEELPNYSTTNIHYTRGGRPWLVTDYDGASVTSRCMTPHNEQSYYSHLQWNSEEKYHAIASANSASVTEEVTAHDPTIKDLLNFFQSILRTADVLHYEQLFITLEDSNRFINYRTLLEHSEKLKFFEDRPDIFTIQPGGFISLVDEEDPKSSQLEDVCDKSDYKETTLVSDNETSKSCDYTYAYEELHLSYYHIFAIKYFIMALRQNQPLHFKQLVKDLCIGNPDTKSFFMLFKTSADLLDFCKLHSMYFIIDDEEMVSLRRSDVIPDEVLSVADELTDIKSSIISKAIEFYRNLLKSKGKLSIRESETELQFAPGHVISFFNTNYPGSKVMNFFIEHPNHFLLDDDGHITLKAMESGTDKTLKNTLDKCMIERNNVVANNGTKTDKVALKLENVDYSNFDNKFVSSFQDHTKVSSKLPENKLPLKVQENTEIPSKVLENIEASMTVHDENKVLLKEHTNVRTHRLLSQNVVPVSPQFTKSTSSKYPDQLQNNTSQTELQDVVKNKSTVKPRLYPSGSFLKMPVFSHNNENAKLQVLQPDTGLRFKNKLIGVNYSDPVHRRKKVSADIKVQTEILEDASNIARNQRAKQIKVKQPGNASQSVTKIQLRNAVNKSNPSMFLPPTMRDKNATFQHPLSFNAINRSNIKAATSYSNACLMESVDQNMPNTDVKIHLSNPPRVCETLKQLDAIAKSYNFELEMQCVNFFKCVLLEKAPRVLHIKFLHAVASLSPDTIRPYLLRYSEEDLLLFFYLHLDHFVVNSLGYVALRIHPNRGGCNDELETKAANFFIMLIHFIFKGKVACDVLERCLYIASDEVQLYFSKTYKTNFKLFFCNHAEHFDIDVFDNVFLK